MISRRRYLRRLSRASLVLRVSLASFVAALVFGALGMRALSTNHAFVQGPTAYTKSITVDNSAAVPLVFSTTSSQLFGICTNQTAGINLFIVSPSAANTSNGEGPYCDTCNDGPQFVVAGNDSARTSAGSADLRCRFYDAGIGSAVANVAGFTRGFADTLYCKLTGCTMTGSTTYSGVTNDIATAGNEDLSLAPGGTGKVIDKLGGNVAQFNDSAGNPEGEILTGATDANFLIRYATGGAAIRMTGAGGNGASVGSTEDKAANEKAGCFGDGLSATGGVTNLVCAYGTGMLGPIPGTALAIVGTPDVTRAPTAGSACHFSAASAGQSWTPAETNAVDGMGFCCTNTGANSVTITASAGVWEGAGGAVAQWKTICGDYVTDRWVQRGSITP
jgi:hypothetical protein